MRTYSFWELEQEILVDLRNPKSTIVRGDPTGTSTKKSVENLYLLNKFHESLDIINGQENNESDDFYLMYKAFNYFKLGEYKRVIRLLENKVGLTEETEELLVYAYLLNRDRSKAEDLIAKLTVEQQNRINAKIK